MVEVIEYFWVLSGEGFNLYAPYDIPLPYNYVRIIPRIKYSSGDYPNGRNEHYIMGMF